MWIPVQSHVSSFYAQRNVLFEKNITAKRHIQIIFTINIHDSKVMLGLLAGKIR